MLDVFVAEELAHEIDVLRRAQRERCERVPRNVERDVLVDPRSGNPNL